MASDEEIQAALQTSDLGAQDIPAAGGRETPTTAPATPTRATEVELPLSRLGTIRARVERGDPVQITDLDRVSMVAHRFLASVVAGQRSGKIPKDRSPWEISVDLALDGFEKKFGRAPEVPEGPRLPTTVEAELAKQKDAVEKVLLPTMTGNVEVERPRDPRQRASTRQEFFPAIGAVLSDIGKGLTHIPEESLQETVYKGLFKGARAGAGMVAATTFLIPMNILGIISDDELDRAAKAIGGT